MVATLHARDGFMKKFQTCVSAHCRVHQFLISLPVGTALAQCKEVSMHELRIVDNC